MRPLEECAVTARECDNNCFFLGVSLAVLKWHRFKICFFLNPVLDFWFLIFLSPNMARFFLLPILLIFDILVTWSPKMQIVVKF